MTSKQLCGTRTKQEENHIFGSRCLFVRLFVRKGLLLLKNLMIYHEFKHSIFVQNRSTTPRLLHPLIKQSSQCTSRSKLSVVADCLWYNPRGDMMMMMMLQFENKCDPMELDRAALLSYMLKRKNRSPEERPQSLIYGTTAMGYPVCTSPDDTRAIERTPGPAEQQKGPS
eukprot:Selendium_serpulae@DN6338_c4_g1_i22.p1